jgi:hypothetical protein
MIKMKIGLYSKYTLILSDFNETRIFWDRFWKNTQILNFMKIFPVGAELFHLARETGGQT